MARNLINPVAAINDRRKRGYPGGVDERSVRDIPVLLARIQELEEALAPFARAIITEVRTNPNAQGPLMQVYRADCFTAKDKLDPTKSSDAPTLPAAEPQYLPAE